MLDVGGDVLGGAVEGGGALLNGFILGDGGGPYDNPWLEGLRNLGQFGSGVLVFGDVRDAGIAIHSIWTTGEGWDDLGLSVIGLVPLLGDAAKGIKGAGNVAEVVDSAHDAGRVVDDAVDSAADAGRGPGVPHAPDLPHSNLPSHVEIGPDGLARVNGRRPINSDWAGRVFDGPTWTDDLAAQYPDGVRFTPEGFPDFGPYAQARVEFDAGLNGNYGHDAALANQAAGLSSTPDGYVWHHVEDGRTLILIPQNLHQGVRHTGGASIIQSAP